ncbi:cell envelope biogenesis protein OmpA [Sorangium cellulosum]|uniref:Cell envelope biogenesis protein OmpA n=1 Tax=Sorangium cellulosum TaxID=56 RepID=A0A150RBZ4_SORCE|nr:cell envelope biogenesis protein OmpA [Sorangium cellulosum]
MDRRHLPGRKPRHRSRLRCALTAAALAAPALAALAPSTARAQDRTFYLDRLRMAGAPDDGIGVWRPHMGERTRLFGQLGLGVSVHPLRNDNYVDDLAIEERLQGDGPVTSQLITYLNAGVEILGRGALQVSFPITLFQDGNQTYNRELGLDESVDLKTAAPMDLRIDARVVPLELDERRFRLGLTGAVFVPIGNTYSFAGDRTVSSAFGIGAEYDFKDFLVTLNTGVAIRPHVQLHELHVGSELTYGVGGYVPLRDGTIRLGAEVFGSFGLIKETRGELDASPIEWQLNSKMFLTQDRALYAGAGVGTRLSGGYAPDFRGVAVFGGSFSIEESEARSPGFNFVIEQEKDADGDGYPDVIDLCPEDPEDGKQPKPSDGCPDMPDRDGDGIPDVVDKCPDDPEDKDGIDDRDGCPEEDADQDGIPDAVDKCPKEPGQVVVDDPEKNGCPYYIRRIQGSAEIEIMKQVEFEFDSSRILPQSYPILDEVVRLLKANPEIKLLSIEGHTDNQGTIDYNDRLAQNRATAVRIYIINKGVQTERLTSAGYGSRRPLVSNDTPEGRQRNRRVEFHIKSQTIEGR